MANKLKGDDLNLLNVTGEHEIRIRNLDKALTLTVFVLLVGFVTMIIAVFSLFINATSERNATYQSLRDQVKEQNEKIDALTKSLIEQRTSQAPN